MDGWESTVNFGAGCLIGKTTTFTETGDYTFVSLIQDFRETQEWNMGQACLLHTLFDN